MSTPLTPTNPISVTYNAYQVISIQSRWSGVGPLPTPAGQTPPTPDYNVIVQLLPIDTTTGQLGPQSMMITLKINGVNAAIAAGDTTLGNAYQTLLTTIDYECRKQGLYS